jgi:hypothetical protein
MHCDGSLTPDLETANIRKAEGGKAKEGRKEELEAQIINREAGAQDSDPAEHGSSPQATQATGRPDPRHTFVPMHDMTMGHLIINNSVLCRYGANCVQGTRISTRRQRPSLAGPRWLFPMVTLPGDISPLPLRLA